MPIESIYTITIMFRPLSLSIGLRYTRAKKRNHFISFISFSSMLGIMLGVAVLITVLSVMNGFDEMIKQRVFAMASQVSVRALNKQMQDYQTLSKQLSALPDVMGIAPFVEGQGLLTHDGFVSPAMISGINPAQQKQVSALHTKMIRGSLTALQPRKFRIVLGEALANNLGVIVGDKITLVTPKSALTPIGVVPTYKRFTVAGIFRVGNGFGFDSQLAMINIKDAQALYDLQGAITGLRLRITDLYDAPMLSRQIRSLLGQQDQLNKYFVTNWTQRYGTLFKAISLEKNMMFLILILIVAVAAFNLVSSLVMVVNEKRSEIAILRTLGATPGMVMRIFIVQGFIVGLVGTLLGLMGGLLLASHVTEVVNFIQNTFNVQLLSANVYYVDYLPSKIEVKDVLQICGLALGLSLFATLYPAWRAARTQPAEALRYE